MGEGSSTDVGLGRRKKLMAIDRSIHAWPKEFSYELDELSAPAPLQLFWEMQDGARPRVRSVSDERLPKFDSDRQTAA
jgi:hypothetical protein